MTDDPLDAMKARWDHIEGSLFPWLREEVDPITEALGRLVTTLDGVRFKAMRSTVSIRRIDGGSADGDDETQRPGVFGISGEAP